MPRKTPIGTTTIEIEGLGLLKGFIYENGVRQFCGIPYARLSKRWTRSQLATSWENAFHDGTKLGCSAPDPPEYKSEDGIDPSVPVKPLPHFNLPVENELECLVMNITLPPVAISSGPLPVMVFIHGGSFLSGGANMAVYDCVNAVSLSVERKTPVISINFNYRVGLGGFLASKAIKDDLAKDGHAGIGNFGLTDQQVALDWIQRYIPTSSIQGDKDNVTIYGESAGGMSVAHQIFAAKPARFQRAISMSGALNTIPTWSLAQHEKRYKALLRHLKIDEDAEDSLDQLRRIPEEVVTAATLPIEGVFVCTGNPCDDGVFHESLPTVANIVSPPSWLQSYMVGDVYDEAIIFQWAILEDSAETLRSCLMKFLTQEQTVEILGMYGFDKSPSTDFRKHFEELAGDAMFKGHNYLSAQTSKIPQTYSYHFDQQSTLDNMYKGTAYHAIDLLYCFLNMTDEMSLEELELAYKFAGDWIDFAYGKDPWERYSISNKSMVYGPTGKATLKSEVEDEEVRRYSRLKALVGMDCFPALFDAMDAFSTKRWLLEETKSATVQAPK